MADKRNTKGTDNSSQARQDRLKAALKANLGRRKSQSRVRFQETDGKNQKPGSTGQDKDA
ncbi:MAG: hypothetical protein ABJL72_06420 [Roseobacter sp.]